MKRNEAKKKIKETLYEIIIEFGPNSTNDIVEQVIKELIETTKPFNY